jgi:hypothetical protein
VAECPLVSEERPCIVNVVSWHYTANFSTVRVVAQQKRACAFPHLVSQQLTNGGICEYTHTEPQKLLRKNAFCCHLATMAVKIK